VAPNVPLPRVFVLRRALIAQRVCTGVSARWHGESRVFLLYAGSPQSANGQNIVSAIASGDAIRVALGRPDLMVSFTTPAELPQVADASSLVVAIDQVGNVYTHDEWEALHRRSAP
jgi:hypothetical protein